MSDVEEAPNFKMQSYNSIMNYYEQVSPSSILILSAMAIAALCVWKQNGRFYQLAFKIPGPPALPILGNILLFSGVGPDTLWPAIVTCVGNYSDTFRIWFGPQLVVCVSNLEDIKICFNSSGLMEKGYFFDKIKDLIGNGLLASTGEIWKKHRRLMNHSFHLSALTNYVGIFDCHSRTMAQRLKKRTHEIIDVFPLFADFSLDVITETAMNARIDAQSDEKRSDFCLSLLLITKVLTERFCKIWLAWDWVFWNTKLGRDCKTQKRVFENFSKSMLESQKKKHEEIKQLKQAAAPTKQSFLSQMLSQDDNSKILTDDELIDEIRTLIVAGYETTAATLSFIIVMLAIHQEIQERVYLEMKSVEEMLDERDIEAKDLFNFPYTDMVIKETLRHFPIAGLLPRKAAAEIKLTTCTIPKGAVVLITQVRALRDPAHWEKPYEFNPDHFLPEMTANRHPHAFYPFGGGPRTCIGKKFAEMSMKVNLFNLLRRFRVTTDMNMENIKLSVSITLKITGGFNVCFAPRESSN